MPIKPAFVSPPVLRSRSRSRLCAGLGLALSFTAVLGAAPAARAVQMPPPWSTVGATSSRAARSLAVGPEDPGRAPAPWPYLTGQPVATSPAIDVDGVAYFASDVKVHAVDPFGTGHVIYKSSAAIQSSPTLFRSDGNDGTGFAALYFGAEDGSVTSIDLNGKPRWTFPSTGRAVRSSPAITQSGGAVFVVVADESSVRVLREAPGGATVTLAWSMPVVADPLAMPSAAISPDGSRVFFGTANGELRCNEVVSGTPHGVFLAGAVGRLTTPLATSNATAVFGAEDGHVYQVDANCHLIAMGMPGGPVRAPLAMADAGLVVNADGTLFLLDQTTLAPMWNLPLPPATARAVPLADNFGRVYLAGDNAMVHGVALPSASTIGGLWWSVALPFTSSSQLGALAMSGDGSLYVPGFEGWLHVLRDIPSFRIAHDRPGTSSSDLAFVNEIYGSVRSRTLFDTPGADELQPSFDYGVERLAFARSTPSTPLDVFIGGRGIAPVSITTPGPGLPFTASSFESEPVFSAVDPRSGASRLPNKQHYVGYTINWGAGDHILFTDLGELDRGLRTAIPFPVWAQTQSVPTPLATLLERPGMAQGQLALSPDGTSAAFRECPAGTFSGCVVQVLQYDGTKWTFTRLGPTGSEATPLEASSPAFSPDSNLLAVRVNGGLAVYPIRSQALVPLPISIPNGRSETLDSPAWSPDGTEIVAASTTNPTRFLTGQSLVIFSGPRFTKRAGASTGRSPNDSSPFYHYRRFPAPITTRVVPDRAFTGDVVSLRGRGFDLIDLQANRVWFTDVMGTGAVRASVLAGLVDPLTGEAVLSIAVPVQAGNGPLTVATLAGAAQVPFLVQPRPVALHQARSAVGMKIRVSGTGFDLSGLTPTANTVVEFTAAAGGWVPAARIWSATRTATGQELVVEVPTGVAKSGPVRTWARTQAEGDQCCTFDRLDPTMTIARGAGIAATAEGCTGVSMTFTGADFPYDPDFGQGVGTITVAINGVDAATTAPQAALVPSTTAPDTVTFSLVRALPVLPFGHPGGSLTVTATTDATPAVTATAMLRVPRTNIPIVFVPGTSGNSLISSGTIVSVPMATGPFSGHQHNFPQNSFPANFNDHFNPGSLLGFGPPYSPYPSPGFLPGQEVWPGRLPLDMIAFTQWGNMGNHYLDVAAFTAAGTQLFPMVAGPPIMDYPGKGDIWGHLINKLALDLGRPIDSGANGIYLFGYDFRDSLPVQAAALSTFVDGVLAKSGASSVVILTQSLGGMVARTYYLGASAAGKVDQVVSQGGGFAGVPLTAKILAVGDNWGLGGGGPALSFGVAEWELQKLSQNWPTSYFQLPNDTNATSAAADPWFFDQGTINSGMVVDRRYIRDTRSGKTSPSPTSASHFTWLAANHNPTVAGMVTAFAPTLPVAMGDFSMGTGSVIHHRIVSRGYPTVTGVQLDKPGSFTIKWVISGDGDGTVPYHGAVGLTAASDDRVYIAEGNMSDPSFKHLETIQNDRTIGLIEGFIGGTVCTQQQAAAMDPVWKSPAQAPERYSETKSGGGASYEQLPSD